MGRRLGNVLIVGILTLVGIFSLNGVASAKEVDLFSISEDIMPQEVKDVVEKLESDNKIGNEIDGYVTQGDPNASLYTQNNRSLNLSSDNNGDFAPYFISPGTIKSNTKDFGYSNRGFSVIHMEVGYPGFWKSLYQNKFDGWGYTSQLNGTYTPTTAVATVYASATGVIPNISTSGSSWGLLNTTRQVGKDTAKWSTRKHAMAFVDDVRVQNISNVTVKFEVKSELHYSAVGSRTTFNSVRFW